MNLATLPAWAAALLADGRVARLGFSDADGHPRVLPITYAVIEDALWSAIDQKPKREGEPARVRWLREQPEAALVIDHYADDWEELAWVQVLGRVSVVEINEDSNAKRALRALTAKYPQYESSPPPGPL